MTSLVGFALYVWLLVAALALAFRRFARDLAGLAALTFGLVIAAVAVHSLFYNAFFEDPTVWAALGLAIIVAPAAAYEPMIDDGYDDEAIEEDDGIRW